MTPDTQELVKRLREQAGGLERRQADYVEHLLATPADHEALDAAKTMREAALALQQERERCAALEEALYPFVQVAKGLPEEFDNRASNMLPVTLFTGAHEPDYQSHRIGRVIIYDLRRAASAIRSNDPGKTG